jgi:hypothetical protein
VRVTGDTTWPSKKDWRHFCDYEDGFLEVIGNQRRAVHVSACVMRRLKVISSTGLRASEPTAPA